MANNEDSKSTGFMPEENTPTSTKKKAKNLYSLGKGEEEWEVEARRSRAGAAKKDI